MEIRPYRHEDEGRVIDLWATVFAYTAPHNAPATVIRHKLAVQPDLFFVALLDGVLVGTVMAGYDGHRGAINYVGVDPELRRRGYGRLLMAASEELLRQRGCPKINLHVRTSNTGVIAFYERLGYKLDPTVCLGKRLD